jgi:amino acid permease
MTFRHRKAFSPMNEMALGFGSVMFAFEGISVVLPIYNRLKKREQFGSFLGIINVSFFSILVLYFVVGLLGFLRYGPDVKDSITLNLPAEPLYDAVRAMFTLSILLSYPLQFYVPNEIIWEWAKRNLIRPPSSWHLKDIDMDDDRDVAIVKTLDIVIAPRGSRGIAALEATSLAKDEATFQGLASALNKVNNDTMVPPIGPACKDGTMSIGSKVELVSDGTSSSISVTDCDTSLGGGDDIPVRYEYYCRLFVVVMTFTLAICIPKLNLLMDLIGSFSGTLLCLTIPALIHLASYWEKLKGFKKCLMITIDSAIITLSLAAGLGGSYSSLMAIVSSNQKG